ncbi:hypothetical protein EO98_14520 [Methanosarcina sp. 2.H.T.1A.6]|uniref:DUF1697 domain-containing protein n=1 Tax=unclassified Methanosarcina TaxID=2644672 RepID=UPI000621ED77|nr:MULTISPECIES: DUF1697 domain-containing protein [unclassified Methanosarcina]KKG18392.1 hypothetical protein EO94_17385 [Methanosarcina sp. 2.H.T.1A.3]KKG23759.1 hypothetical protein EO98_14520 [Methanosarcina sp. 2.H.T.1A.6]KKG24737.1 hypothetical protein EO96_16890 [Methanosarcina sp. 2.H.T.1A.8]KKG27499.1 hypothetical protein EO97_10985 [Methanosarcina sp. 2.H.T.1A.15]
MEKYIALLRGINISGKNKVSMPLLKVAFEDMGFLNVSTYINSGNVLFSSENNNESEISSRCKAMIEERFMLDVPVVIISLKELSEALDNTPKWWDINSDEEMIYQAIFLIPPITIEEVYKAVGEPKPEYEQVGYYKNVIFWSAPRATLSKTRWYKIASSSVNNKVTIRNASTTKKLLLLSNE